MDSAVSGNRERVRGNALFLQLAIYCFQLLISSPIQYNPVIARTKGLGSIANLVWCLKLGRPAKK